MIATSHCEVLGFRDLGEGKQWGLTYFPKDAVVACEERGFYEERRMIFGGCACWN